MFIVDRNSIVEALSRFVSTSKVWLKKLGWKNRVFLSWPGLVGVGAVCSDMRRVEIVSQNQRSERSFWRNLNSVHDEAAIAARYIGEEAKAEHRVRAVIWLYPICTHGSAGRQLGLVLLCQPSTSGYRTQVQTTFGLGHCELLDYSTYQDYDLCYVRL